MLPEGPAEKPAETDCANPDERKENEGKESSAGGGERGEGRESEMGDNWYP